ncbi:MAG: nitroreductase family protein [Oceanicaulis sp.]
MTFTPDFPAPGDTLDAARKSDDTLQLLARRRSATAKAMTGPGPSPDQIETLLKIGARVPDHGKLFPWRFVVFEGEARARFGEILEQRLREIEPDGPAERYELEKTRFLRAPLVIAVVSDPVENHKIPEWEQVLSAGAVCQTLLIAANAMGFAAQWLTEWYAYDRVTKKALGLDPGEAVAGFIYVGTAAEAPAERPRKAPRVSRWGG